MDTGDAKMAKARIKPPLDAINGTIWGADRTIGRNPGLASGVRENVGVTKSDASTGLKKQLVSKKAPTRGGSHNRHTRAERYCCCDQAYQMLGWPKVSYVQPWWRKVTDDPHAKISGYHAYMKCCLKYMAETSAFSRFSFVARFLVKNDTDVAWVNKTVEFYNITTRQDDGWDLEAFLLLDKTTKKKRITYDRLMIDMRLITDVEHRGRALVKIPSLDPHSSCLVDVYSWFKPSPWSDRYGYGRS